MPDNPAEEPKLIIDEDWKSQVQREKEELKQKQAASQTQGGETIPSDPLYASSPTSHDSSDPSGPTRVAEGGAKNSSAPPPASLMLLVTTLATQAMGAMGLMPDEKGEPLSIHLDFARHFIDMLSVLEEKTQGNLSNEEKNYLSDALHQLRMAFVTVSKQHAAQTPHA